MPSTASPLVPAMATTAIPGERTLYDAGDGEIDTTTCRVGAMA